MKYILVLSILIQSMAVAASDMSISYADFLILDHHKKVETIKLIHSYMIEYENRQILSGQNPKSLKQDKKYQVYKKFMKLLISEAYASNAINSTAVLNSLQAAGEEGRCIYAGHISSMHQFPGEAKQSCINPSLQVADDQRQESFDAYLFDINQDDNNEKIRLSTQTDNLCNANNSVRCNPEIFGKVNDRPICVKTDFDRGLNATYACQQALDHIKSFGEESVPGINGSSSGQEIYNSMMNSVIQSAVNSNSDTLDESLQMMFDSCLCGREATNTSITPHPFSTPGSSPYARYARGISGSRTCVGILNQVSNILDNALKSCRSNPESFSNTDFSSWVNYMRNIDNSLEDNIQQTLSGYSPRTSQNPEEDQATFRSSLAIQDSELFASTAQGIYETAKQRGLCPTSNRNLKIELTRENGKIIAQFKNTNNFDSAALSRPTLIANNEGFTSQADGEDLATLNYEYSYSNNAGKVVKVYATATINDYEVRSNMISLTGPLQLIGDFTQNAEDPTKGEITLRYTSCNSDQGCDETSEGQQPSLQAKEPTNSDVQLGTASTGMGLIPIVGNAVGSNMSWVIPVTRRPSENTTVTFNGAFLTPGQESVNVTAEVLVTARTPDPANLRLSGDGIQIVEGNDNSYNLVAVIEDMEALTAEGDPDPAYVDKEDILRQDVALSLVGSEEVIQKQNVDPAPMVHIPIAGNIALNGFSITGKIGDTEADEPVEFEAVTASCVLTKSESSVNVNIESNLSLSPEHIDLSALTLASGGADESPQSREVSIEDGQTSFSIDLEDTEKDKANYTLNGVSIKIDGINVGECKYERVSVEECPITIAGPQISGQGGRPSATLAVSSTEDDVYFSWYNLNKSARNDDDDSSDDDEADSDSRMVDSEEDQESEDDTSTAEEEIYNPFESTLQSVAGKLHLGRSKNLTVRQGANPITVRVIAFRGNDQACNSTTKEIPAIRPSNTNPVQLPPSPGLGQQVLRLSEKVFRI